jgi:hypothetical protein
MVLVRTRRDTYKGRTRSDFITRTALHFYERALGIMKTVFLWVWILFSQTGFLLFDTIVCTELFTNLLFHLILCMMFPLGVKTTVCRNRNLWARNCSSLGLPFKLGSDVVECLTCQLSTDLPFEEAATVITPTYLATRDDVDLGFSFGLL